MDPVELIWLATQAYEHKFIVEVGSFLGRSTRAMADNTSGLVFAFDDWFGPRDINLDGREHCYEVFVKNMSDLIDYGKVIVIKGDHGDISVIPEWLSPDMVFIDGSHEYESVKRDIYTWKAKLASGGLLCGHDAQLPGVRQALDESCPGWEVSCSTEFGTQIWSMPVA